MKKYKCHKVVEASKILGMSDDGDDQVTFVVADQLPGGGNELVQAPKNILSRYKPVEGDYLVKCEDGYLAISPGKAFEDGYSELCPDDYKQRVVNEEKELLLKMDALLRFINSRKFKSINHDGQKRLHVQADAMLSYLNALTDRTLYF